MAINTYEFITQQDLKNIFGETSEIFLKSSEEMWATPINSIKSMCDLFMKLINLPNANMEEIYKFGFLIIKSTREFLLQESIDYIIGATSPDGTGLSFEKISSKDLFNHIEIDLNNEIIQLESNIEKYNPDKRNKRYSNSWSKVLKYGIHNKYNAKIIERIPQSKNPKETREIYRTTDPDTNVYIGFSGKLKLYYYNRVVDFLNYNKGWLFEWYMAYVTNGHYFEMIQSLQKPDEQLFDLMWNSSRENISGVKGGDFIWGKQQYQAKMNNQQIITFKQIKKVVKDIQNNINKYSNINTDQNKEKMAKGFMDIFTHKETLNKSYDKTLNGILKQLNKA